MQEYNFRMKPMTFPGINPPKPKKKRQLTNPQKIWCWENNPHICNICRKRVSKFSDAEFDHARSYSKGGVSNLTNVKITHRQCNRLKGTKTLAEARRLLGVKTKKKKQSKKRKTRKKKTDDYGFPAYKFLRPPKFKL